MLAAELDQISAALGQEVLGTRRLAGGFSHETCLLTLADGHLVARLGSQDQLIEAAVMAEAGARVPVPEVVLVLPAGAGSRSAMVTDYLEGTPLSDVLAGGYGSVDLRALGAEVGRVSARIGQVRFERPGFFADSTLSVTRQKPWSRQLAGFAAACMDAVPQARLDSASRDAWARMCAEHAEALAVVDAWARLVHADLNPKNLLVERTGKSGWRVAAVLDWEFSFSGCTYADAANMVRFASQYPAGFAAGFLEGFALHQPPGSPLPGDWLYLGRVFDMFALSDLATRPEGHLVADEAAVQIRRWIDFGVPDCLQASHPPGACAPGAGA